MNERRKKETEERRNRGGDKVFIVAGYPPVYFIDLFSLFLCRKMMMPNGSAVSRQWRLEGRRLQYGTLQKR